METASTPPSTLPAIVIRHAQASPEAPAVVQYDSNHNVVVSSVTYRSLADDLLAVSSWLAALGVARNGKCALVGYNSASYLCHSLACMHLGGISVHVNWRMPASVIADSLCPLRCHAILHSNGLTQHAEEVGQLAKLPVHRFGTMGGPGPTAAAFLGTVDAPPGAAHPEDTCLIFFTSGSTGKAKAIPHTHVSILWFARSYAASLPGIFGLGTPPQQLGSLSFAPFFHVMGFIVNTIFNISIGSPLYVLAADEPIKLTAELMLKAVATLEPACLNTVPWVVEALCAALAAGEPLAAALQKLQLLTYGGAALPSYCTATLRAYGVRTMCTYGQTELAGPVMIGAIGGDLNALRPFAGVTYRLLPTDEGEQGQAGELVLQGLGCVARMRYNGDGQLVDAPSVRGDAVHTGDRFRIVTIGGEAWLNFECRRDDVLVHTSGEMTNPLPTEDLVKSRCPHIVAAVVMVGTNQPRPTLIVQLHRGVDLNNIAVESSLHEIVRDANARLPSYSTLKPNAVWLLDPAHDEPLAVSDKGNVIRSQAEARLQAVLSGVVTSTHPRTLASVARLEAATDNGPAFDSLQLTMDGPYGTQRTSGESSADAVDSLQSTSVDTRSAGSGIVLAHLYVLCMALVLLHHMPKLHEGCNHGCGAMLAALETFGEAVAMPVFCVLAGVRDRQLRSASIMWRVAAHTSLLLGGCLWLAYYSSAPDKAYWFYREKVFRTNKGVHKAPYREYFVMHTWFMVALPVWRCLHASLRSLDLHRLLPTLGMLSHFACWGNNCRWPFLRHPHELEESVAAYGYFGGSRPLKALAAALPQNDVSVMGPYLFFYATLPAILPADFPSTLPSPVGRIAGRIRTRWASGEKQQFLARVLWGAGLLASLAVFSDPALRPLVDAALWHSKRAYGCSQGVFPPRSLTVRADDLSPCGMGGAGGWSTRAFALDLAGVGLSTLAMLGAAAAMPRRRTAWTEAGERTLSVYAFHLYVLPAVEVPFTALVQVVAFHMYPEGAAAVALCGSIMLVRAFALPLPALQWVDTLVHWAGSCARRVTDDFLVRARGPWPWAGVGPGVGADPGPTERDPLMP